LKGVSAYFKIGSLSYYLLGATEENHQQILRFEVLNGRGYKELFAMQ
jgi:hypothetical protein